jgi:GNAT superfamily N-acetyltransferase
MTALSVEPVRESDLDDVAAMVDDFVRGHPAQHHPRPRESLRAAYLGPRPVAELLVARRQDRIVGMGQWRLIYDMFWATHGAHVEWLYVCPELRGFGIAAAVVAEICARVRAAGGQFLQGSGNENVAALYERVAIGSPMRECILGAEAFQVFADLAGASPREIVRGLPARALNRVPARPRGSVPPVRERPR